MTAPALTYEQAVAFEQWLWEITRHVASVVAHEPKAHLYRFAHETGDIADIFYEKTVGPLKDFT